MKLEEMKKLCRKATPAPWFHTHVYSGEELITTTDAFGKSLGIGSCSFAADVEFIAAARKLMPALLELAAWAEAAVEMYGFQSDYQDPMHQLAVVLRDLGVGTGEGV